MKLRTSFQVQRNDNKDNGSRPAAPAIHWKIPNLREKQSKPADLNENKENKDELSLASPSTGTQDHEYPLGSPKIKASTESAEADVTSKNKESQLRRSVTKKKAMQDWMQKTSAQIKTQSASLKLRGQKLSEGMKGNKKSKVVKPPSKRNSQHNSQINIKYTSDSEVIERIIASQCKEKQASASFTPRKRANAQRKPSSTISPLSETQAEKDRKPLNAEEVLTMFIGAPYFSVENRKPRVIFRGGDAVRAARYSTDYEKMDVSSFGACTLGQHRTRQLEGKPPPCCHETEAAKEESSLLELPSMLAATGREPGAIGFEHFLQLPLADNLLVADQLPNKTKRRLLKSDPKELGLRKLDMEDIIKRLNELADLFATEREEAEAAHYWNADKVEELGEDLFTNVLSDELNMEASETSTASLKTQISALQTVLDETGVWHNFSIVEWRIRAGQLLWASGDSEKPSERNVLLLQITLAAELLIRLKAFESLPVVVTSSEPPLSVEDAEVLGKERSTKVKWDLLLAERFLNNLSIFAKKSSEQEDNKKQNRSSLWSAITFMTARETVEDDLVEPILSPKDDLRQIDGLVKFAEAIHWPHAKDIREDMEAKLSAGAVTPKDSGVGRLSTTGSEYATPLSSPMFSCIPSTGSFGLGESRKRPGFARSTTAQSVRLLPSRTTTSFTGLDTQEAFEVGGWLSRSWLSGLVMPGESASHLLISTLLENCPQAITALGAEANLYGGFVYEGRSFWSKGCVVGRVLGAVEGSTECMGWISVPGAGTEKLEDGWLNVNVKESPFLAAGSARIKNSVAVEQASDPLHGEDLASIQAGDFTTPTDGNLVMGNEAKFRGISVDVVSENKPSKESSLPMGGVGDAEPSNASLIFSSPVNGKLSKIVVPLTYDVQFVSSYPCHPARPKAARMPSKPKTSPKLSLEQEREGSPKPTDSALAPKMETFRNVRASLIDKDLPPPPAHPLHIDYQFDTVPVATLISAPSKSRPRALSAFSEREAKQSVATDEDIVVLDCRGPEDLELLARAWCAKVGENALIGKSGRTCLACCVREARALGIAILIRT